MGLINQVGVTLEEEEALAAHLLLAGLGISAIADKSAPKVRAGSVTTPLEYIEQHPADVVTIGEICAAKVSPGEHLTVLLGSVSALALRLTGNARGSPEYASS